MKVFKSIIKEYTYYLNILARILDGMMLYIAGSLAYFLKFNSAIDIYGIYGSAVFLLVLISLFFFPIFQVYHSWRGKNLLEQLFILLKACTLAFLSLFMIGFLTKTSAIISREWVVYWIILSVVLLVAIKLIIYLSIRTIRNKGNNERCILYIGDCASIKEMNNTVEQSPWAGYRGIGWASIVDDKKERIQGIEYIGELKAIKQAIIDFNPDEIWVVTHLTKLQYFHLVNIQLQNETINLKFIPDFSGTPLDNYPHIDILGRMAWDVSFSPFTENKRLIKELEDKVLGLLFFILLSPLMVLIAIGVKLSSPGPILFKQKRHGWDGKIINVYKFRSMKIHQETQGNIAQARKNDIRVTWFGRFIRQSNLDEIPQFYNVLQGRMSIVGPRPHAIEHNYKYEELIDDYMRRHKVKPGITGWAQVNGWRGETNTLEKMQKRVDYDLYYIRNCSFWFDIKIIFLTVLRTFMDKNAY
ncbi:MAG: undecaprenyl-phosphate glucose phosphotransferase [Methylococcales symbiont of Hymedesmia sp. n. MRB-2018]|nr:MAG: undecaprenyl-phosphate glucose phosphotransferase [Methylococcales symbiont of Hymedesmia sp. n. MRB-2018]